MNTNTKNKQPVKPALHLVTRDQLNERNEYVGTVDLSNFDGAIAFSENLGRVVFSGAIRAARYILAEAGTGIEAGEGIKAGEGIEVRLRVFAGLISWRLPEAADLEVRCKSFSGTLAYGKLALIEPPKPEPKKAAKKSAKKGGAK